MNEPRKGDQRRQPRRPEGGDRARRPSAPPHGVQARRLAVELLRRIEEDGAYANLVVPAALNEADRYRDGPGRATKGLVTDLTYGSTRLRARLDYIVSQFASRPPDPTVARLLRVGAYELLYTQTAPYAVVDQCVAAAPPAARGFVNAILRKVGQNGTKVKFPDAATELSYPQWIIDRLVRDLGPDRALAYLNAMNQPVLPKVRPDGYRQDSGSREVVDVVPVQPGTVVWDMCAAPGGKATALAERGATVIASDRSERRVTLMRRTARRLHADIACVVADGTAAPVRDGAADVVVVDAPCSGLGVLHRRPDARWRREGADVDALSRLQGSLLDSAARAVTPAGTIVYSVCTVTEAETVAVVNGFLERHGDFSVTVPTGGDWEEWGPVGRLSPEGRDGMCCAVLQRNRAE